MPLSVNDLQPGDRVVLNCPKARIMRKREAQFEGIFRSSVEASERGNRRALLISKPTIEFLASGGAWARFLMESKGLWDVVAAFVIEPDGSMREEEGRRIFIERRMRMGQG
jgi:hypothetical protein